MANRQIDRPTVVIAISEGDAPNVISLIVLMMIAPPLLTRYNRVENTPGNSADQSLSMLLM